MRYRTVFSLRASRAHQASRREFLGHVAGGDKPSPLRTNIECFCEKIFSLPSRNSLFAGNIFFTENCGLFAESFSITRILPWICSIPVEAGSQIMSNIPGHHTKDQSINFIGIKSHDGKTQLDFTFRPTLSTSLPMKMAYSVFSVPFSFLMI